MHVFHNDFVNGNTDSELVSIDVNVNIDAVSWSPCHNFVLLALSNGRSQLVHIPTKVPLPSVSILSEKDVDVKIPEDSINRHIPNAFVACWFEATKEESIYSLLFLSVDGVVSIFYLECPTHLQLIQKPCIFPSINSN